MYYIVLLYRIKAASSDLNKANKRGVSSPRFCWIYTAIILDFSLICRLSIAEATPQQSQADDMTAGCLLVLIPDISHNRHSTVSIPSCSSCICPFIWVPKYACDGPICRLLPDRASYQVQIEQSPGIYRRGNTSTEKRWKTWYRPMRDMVV